MNIALTGASGFLGSAVVRALLEDGHTLSALGRSRGALPPAVAFHQWNAMSGVPAREAREGAQAVIHLAGEPVAQRWNAEVKRRIRDSRVTGTRNLVSGLLAVEKPPEVLVSASAVGIYGSRGDEALSEDSPPGAGFLAEVCQEWEAEAQRASQAGIRVVALRIGIVLGRGGGALKAMLPPFRMGLGGPLGAGNQWMPWIHLEDITGLIRHAIETRTLNGPLNATAPAPVTNREFTRTLGRVLRRPAFMPVPEFAIRLLYGEMASVVLASQRVLPQKALASGYRFRFENLEEALRDVLLA